MACAGNPSELCGGGNRVQVYQDITWVVPTASQLVTALQQYNDTLAQAKDDVSNYHQDMMQYQMDLAANPSTKRQTGISALLMADLGNIEAAFAAGKAIQQEISTLALYSFSSSSSRVSR
jgi:hypothetical protein